MSFNELRSIYLEHFSLGNIGVTEGRTAIENRFILISLIAHVYSKTKPKNPDLTYYSLIYKLCNNMGFDENFIQGLAITVEDFAYGCSVFPTFGLKGKEILSEIQKILKSWLPF